MFDVITVFIVTLLILFQGYFASSWLHSKQELQIIGLAKFINEIEYVNTTFD